MQFYRELLGALARKGFVNGRGVTLSEFAAAVEAHRHPELVGVSQVIDLYYKVR